MAKWHAPGREVGSDGLQLARVGQLPQLLTQQREEERQMEKELKELRRSHDEKLVTRHKVKKLYKGLIIVTHIHIHIMAIQYTIIHLPIVIFYKPV